jgi:hypothetical protein
VKRGELRKRLRLTQRFDGDVRETQSDAERLIRRDALLHGGQVVLQYVPDLRPCLAAVDIRAIGQVSGGRSEPHGAALVLSQRMARKMRASSMS